MISFLSFNESHKKHVRCFQHKHLGSRNQIREEEVSKNSGANSWVLNNLWGPKVLKGDFTSGMDLNLSVKDTGLALTSGRALKVPLLLGSLVHQIYQMEAAAGKGELDGVSSITSLENLAGVQVRSGKSG